jgi:hypothetical protein
VTITQQSATPRPASHRRPLPAFVAVVAPNPTRTLGKIGLLLLATSIGAAVVAGMFGLGALFLLSAVGR